MTLDFFVRLTLAAHKVAGILPQKEPFAAQLQGAANRLLAALVLLAQESTAGPEQKRQAVPKAVKELGVLIAYLNYARRMSQVNPENFAVLEREYSKVGEFLRKIHEPGPVRNPSQNTSSPQGELSPRQFRILELLRNKEKTQVWELQKVLPEVTKRTLRRDLDDLLHRNLIVRQGEWNEVFYVIR